METWEVYKDAPIYYTQLTYYIHEPYLERLRSTFKVIVNFNSWLLSQSSREETLALGLFLYNCNVYTIVKETRGFIRLIHWSTKTTLNFPIF